MSFKELQETGRRNEVETELGSIYSSLEDIKEQQTDGTQQTKIVDVDGNVVQVTNHALNVAITNGDIGPIATEPTLQQVETHVGSIDTKLNSLATETTLQSIDNQLSSGITTTVTGYPALVVTNAVDSVAYNLLAAPFSSTTNVTSDYFLSRAEFNFSTASPRTITITSSDGSVLYKSTNDTSLNLSIDFGKVGFNTDENITVAVTQTTGACSMDCVLTVEQGSATIAGGTAIKQEVTANSQNSSTANLAAGATYTGTGSSTLDIAGIQVSLKTDQNCTVYIDQSPDNTNWDLTDSYNYYASINNFGVTVQAINSYFRVRVTNTSASTTTYFRLQSALCPIIEAVPRSLDTYGNFKVGVKSMQDLYGFSVENTPMGEMRTVEPIRLVGSIFDGTTVDTNFWTVTNSAGGTTTQANGQITLATNTTSNGSTKFNSVRRARYISGSSNGLRMQLNLGDTGTANNKRRWGIAFGATMPTITDGAFFQLNGTTFSIVTLKGSSETVVSSGSFNGTLGSVYAPTTTNTTYEIYWTNGKVYFVVGDVILHTVVASSTTWTNTLSQYIFLDNVNSGGSTTNVTMNCRAASIRRLGALVSQAISKFQSGTTAGVVYKYGAGNLHGLVISSVSNNAAVTLYDNTAASGTILWQSGAMPANTTPFDLDFQDLPFSTGLTLVIATANCSVLTIYE